MLLIFSIFPLFLSINEKIVPKTATKPTIEAAITSGDGRAVSFACNKSGIGITTKTETSRKVASLCICFTIFLADYLVKSVVVKIY